MLTVTLMLLAGASTSANCDSDSHDVDAADDRDVGRRRAGRRVRRSATASACGRPRRREVEAAPAARPPPSCAARSRFRSTAA